ncbi:MAG TPA: K(+)-transporting ATPase subunit F [Candidatus Dormibacteraeota bacterium]|nr:K(+)-transporting ATPase subunit F [Candidatus Dormibacteraeota bacterium]
MSVEDILLLILATVTFVYLVFALVRPERF